MRRGWATEYFRKEGTVSTWWDPLSEEDPAFRRWILDQTNSVLLASKPHGKLVVDAATGRGRAAIACAEQGASHVVGIDISLEMLQIAHNSAGRAGQVHWVGGGLDRLPLKDGIADVVLLLETLLHLEDPARALSECARILSPSGLLMLTTNGANPIARLFQQGRRGRNPVPSWKLAVATAINEIMTVAFGFCWRRTRPTAKLYRQFFNAPVRPIFTWQVRRMLRKAGFRAVYHQAVSNVLLPREHRWVGLK